ncbi:MAG TPA: S1C family serine protease [bacterium]|nr:S1C family serine protease [bacterium]
MQGLNEISGELSGIVEKAASSVVRVEARRRIPGSGIVWAADGTIVTADHSIEREEDLRIGLADGRVAEATLVGRDPTTDVAVLRAQAVGLPVPAWSDGERAKVGQLVLALARPGRTVRARLGMISALGDAWRAPAGGELTRYLEADVAIRFGFSGGPLVDTAGAVLGMNTAGLLREAALTVPVATLRRVVTTLLKDGRIRRGYLGLGAHPVRLPAAWQQQGQEAGLLIVSVEPGSPAERGGLLIGDTLVAIDGTSVRRHDDIQTRLTPESVGTSVRVRLMRGGEVKELTVTIGERPTR